MTTSPGRASAMTMGKHEEAEPPPGRPCILVGGEPEPDQRPRPAWRVRLMEDWRRVRAHKEAGLATAEYAVATIAAAGFAGLLIVILKSAEVRKMLTDIVRTALSIG